MNDNYLTPRPHPSACDEMLHTYVEDVLDGHKTNQNVPKKVPFQIKYKPS